MEHVTQVILLVIEGLLAAALSYAGYKLKQYRESELKIERDEKDQKELQLLTTRLILIREINYYLEKGFAPLYAVGSVTDIYKKYHDLGGNGGIEEIYRGFLSLPHRLADRS